MGNLFHLRHIGRIAEPSNRGAHERSNGLDGIARAWITHHETGSVGVDGFSACETAGKKITGLADKSLRGASSSHISGHRAGIARVYDPPDTRARCAKPLQRWAEHVRAAINAK
jgi:hypothetical protein